MGREFIDIFEEWADTYDESVIGNNPQYQAVFANYDAILTEVTENSIGNVLEFGVGTGNLTEKLIKAGRRVVGIEPSNEMRKIAVDKIQDVVVLDGDFIQFPELPFSIETIVSTYAFHHLTDAEKGIAIKQFSEMLRGNGRVVFADTMFRSEVEKELMIEDAMAKGFTDLAEDLQREYYPTIDVIQQLFKEHHFDVSFRQLNDFVWLLIAIKK